MDWLHAILHKLEGDFRNAKMWYTDLGNNNVGAEDGMDEIKLLRKAEEKERGSLSGSTSFGLFLIPMAALGRGPLQRNLTCNDLRAFHMP